MAFSPETYALLKGQGGGGGGGLPTPTEEDVGSVLTVQKVPVQGAAIAPEQTVTYDEEGVAVLTPAEGYESLFVNDADVLAVVDGVSYHSRVVDNNGDPYLYFGGGRFELYVYNGDLLFYDDNSEATTVACYVAGYAYEWVPAYPSVRVLSCEATETTLVASATWQEIHDMVSSGLMVGIKDEYEMHATMYFVLDVSDYPGGYKVTTTLPSQQGFADWIVNSTSDYPTWTFE